MNTNKTITTEIQGHVFLIGLNRPRKMNAFNLEMSVALRDAWKRFENDPDVIATAADRQMAHIKSFATGPFSSDSQKLLDELAQARICLLNPTAKQAYDAGLRQARSGATADTEATSERTNFPGIGAGSAGADAEHPPAIRVTGQRAESIASGIAGRRRRERKHATMRITGHIVFSLIGLSIALNVIQNHGGDVQIRSVPGERTEFRINLPFLSEDE